MVEVVQDGGMEENQASAASDGASLPDVQVAWHGYASKYGRPYHAA